MTISWHYQGDENEPPPSLKNPLTLAGVYTTWVSCFIPSKMVGKENATAKIELAKFGGLHQQAEKEILKV